MRSTTRQRRGNAPSRCRVTPARCTRALISERRPSRLDRPSPIVRGISCVRHGLKPCLRKRAPLVWARNGHETRPSARRRDETAGHRASGHACGLRSHRRGRGFESHHLHKSQVTGFISSASFPVEPFGVFEEFRTVSDVRERHQSRQCRSHRCRLRCSAGPSASRCGRNKPVGHAKGTAWARGRARDSVDRRFDDGDAVGWEVRFG